jgi:hypothetical protein
MKRAILFITPHMDDPNIDNAIAPFIQRAIDTKVRVFIWFVDGDITVQLAQRQCVPYMLAQQTNGAFFAFSGTGDIPDPNLYFAPLRNIYSLTYTSVAHYSGDHTLSLSVDTADGQIRALTRNFSVDVQPPNPIFVSPPLQITRQPPADDPYADAVDTLGTAHRDPR